MSQIQFEMEFSGDRWRVSIDDESGHYTVARFDAYDNEWQIADDSKANNPGWFSAPMGFVAVIFRDLIEQVRRETANGLRAGAGS